MKAPRIEPITIPAICPPESPFLFCVLGGEVDELVAVDGVAVEVEVKRGCIVEVATIGRTTLSQRDVVLEYTQQESVAFGELAAQ